MAKEGSEARILEALEALAGEHGIDVVDVEVVGSVTASLTEPSGSSVVAGDTEKARSMRSG